MKIAGIKELSKRNMINTTRSTTTSLSNSNNIQLFIYIQKGDGFSSNRKHLKLIIGKFISTYTILWEDHQYKSVIEYIKH